VGVCVSLLIPYTNFVFDHSIFYIWLVKVKYLGLSIFYHLMLPNINNQISVFCRFNFSQLQHPFIIILPGSKIFHRLNFMGLLMNFKIFRGKQYRQNGGAPSNICNQTDNIVLGSMEREGKKTIPISTCRY